MKGHGGIVAQPADVALIVDCDSGHAVGLSLGYGHLHGSLGHHEAEPPVAVDHRSAGRFPLHLEGSARNDVALVYPVGVDRNIDHSVGVVAHQVGFDDVIGYGCSFFFRGTLGQIHVECGLVKVFVIEDGHWTDLIQTSSGDCWSKSITGLGPCLPAPLVTTLSKIWGWYLVNGVTSRGGPRRKMKITRPGAAAGIQRRPGV